MIVTKKVIIIYTVGKTQSYLRSNSDTQFRDSEVKVPILVTFFSKDLLNRFSLKIY